MYVSILGMELMNQVSLNFKAHLVPVWFTNISRLPTFFFL